MWIGYGWVLSKFNIPYPKYVNTCSYYLFANSLLLLVGYYYNYLCFPLVGFYISYYTYRESRKSTKISYTVRTMQGD
jgi:hypothetical protein